MARTLSLHELAAEAGAEAELIDRLTSAGVLRPDPEGRYRAGDVIRLEAVEAFLSAGVTLDQVEAALSEGIFTFDHLDRFHPEPPATTGRSLGELAEELSISPDLVSRVYLALGFPEPSPERALRQDEETLIESFFEAWRAGSDEDTYVRAARLIGEPARQVAEGWTRLYVEKISTPLSGAQIPTEDRIAVIVRSTERLARLAPPFLLWLLDRHLRTAIDRANIEGLEEEFVSRGLSLPSSRPPAVSLVDISGYTRLAEAHGDELALRTADQLRHLADRATRAHGGTVVKMLGDGVMLHFPDPRHGVAGVLDLVERLGSMGLPAHAGMHAGPLIEHDRDYFGRTVNIASRVADAAGAGEFLVTDAVNSVAGGGPYLFHRLPPLSLKGVEGQVPVYRVTSAGGSVEGPGSTRARGE